MPLSNDAIEAFPISLRAGQKLKAKRKLLNSQCGRYRTQRLLGAMVMCGVSHISKYRATASGDAYVVVFPIAVAKVQQHESCGIFLGGRALHCYTLRRHY